MHVFELGAWKSRKLKTETEMDTARGKSDLLENHNLDRSYQMVWIRNLHDLLSTQVC